MFSAEQFSSQPPLSSLLLSMLTLSLYALSLYFSLFLFLSHSHFSLSLSLPHPFFTFTSLLICAKETAATQLHFSFEQINNPRRRLQDRRKDVDIKDLDFITIIGSGTSIILLASVLEQ